MTAVRPDLSEAEIGELLYALRTVRNDTERQMRHDQNAARVSQAEERLARIEILVRKLNFWLRLPLEEGSK